MEVKPITQDNQIITDATVELSKGGEYFAGDYIMAIIPKQENELIIGAFGSGLHIYNKTSGISTAIEYKNQKLDAYNYILQHSLFHGIDLQSNNLALATYQKGLILSDYNGQISILIDKSTGLQDETITYAYNKNTRGLDDQLWITLARGIARIEINSPIRLFEEQTNINDIIMFDKVIYQASDYGITYMTFDENKLPVFIDINRRQCRCNRNPKTGIRTPA